MNRLCLMAVVLVCFIVPAAVMAAEFNDYPSFRYTLGMPGGGNGVTPDGHLGFDGALQLNIPVGYTPGFGNFMITASSANVNGGFPTDYSGPDVNGTFTMGLGLLKGQHTLWFSSMGTGEGVDSLEPALNLQLQVVRESRKWPGIAIGVTDILNQRASALTDPFAGEGRSFYVVATREGGTPEKPLYYTVGWGTDRYKHPFGGVSYQPLERLKVLAEYDGWSPNVGAAYDLVSSPDWHAIVGLGLVNFERIDLSLSLTKTDF